MRSVVPVCAFESDALGCLFFLGESHSSSVMAIQDTRGHYELAISCLPALPPSTNCPRHLPSLAAADRATRDT